MAYRITVRTPTRKIPFQLTYRSEAVILVEFGLTSTGWTIMMKERTKRLYVYRSIY